MLKTPDNVTVLQLPPYSPELNPLENLWHYLNSHYWSNRAYADYEELEEAAVDAWRTAALDPELRNPGGSKYSADAKTL